MSLVSISFRAGADGTIAVPNDGGLPILVVTRAKGNKSKEKPYCLMPLNCEHEVEVDILKHPHGGYNEMVTAAKALLQSHGYHVWTNRSN